MPNFRKFLGVVKAGQMLHTDGHTDIRTYIGYLIGPFPFGRSKILLPDWWEGRLRSVGILGGHRSSCIKHQPVAWVPYLCCKDCLLPCSCYVSSQPSSGWNLCFDCDYLWGCAIRITLRTVPSFRARFLLYSVIIYKEFVSSTINCINQDLAKSFTSRFGTDLVHDLLTFSMQQVFGWKIPGKNKLTGERTC